MVTPKERREREKTELREKILDAAREMFVKEGVEAVTMRTLAKRIEYSPTAIYHHFEDKEALLEELCTRDLAELSDNVREEADRHTGLERLHAAARAYVRFALDHRPQYQLLFMMPHGKAQAEGADRQAYELLRQSFSELVDLKLFRTDLKDPDLLAQIYFCGLHGIVASRIAMGEACALAEWRDPETQATFFVDTLLKGLLP